MCDYSAEAVDRRDARVGESLEMAYITEAHLTHGLVDPNAPTLAVCLCEGNRLRMALTPGLQTMLGLSEPQALGTFQKRVLAPGQVDYRDGVIFDGDPEGRLILFQDIEIGTKVDVMSLDDLEDVPLVRDAAPARTPELVAA